MEQQQRGLIFTAAVGLIILAIIVSSIYYLVKFIQSRVASSRQAPQASVETVASDSANPQSITIPGGPAVSSTATARPSAQLPTTGARAGKKTYNPGAFQLYYPQNWGMLKCANSANFEFDPVSGADSGVTCDTAIKPVTVLVNDINGCDGENLKMGNVEVMKSRKIDGDYTSYRWCTKTDPVLNITHRVSRNGEQATSPNDYSTQIEDFITNLTFTHGS